MRRPACAFFEANAVSTPTSLRARRFNAPLALVALGVVYGDIGTSPLYAFREAVNAGAAGGPITREVVLGVLSMIVWSLIVVVTLKYVVVLLRADNNGEGGTLALMKPPEQRRAWRPIPDPSAPAPRRRPARTT
jgi:K+ transporter